ncbi:SIS domain-containing protein [Verrucomicrobiota bacterium]
MKKECAVIKEKIQESVDIIESLSSKADNILEITRTVISVLRSGGKVMTAGNGGSAAEALHMAEELVGRFKMDRTALPGIALTADSTVLTCIGNDYGFDKIFSRQVEALGKPGDILILFSTSGKAKNLDLALQAARKRKMQTVCMLGRDGGLLAGQGDYEIIVEGSATERIQEAHQVLVHLILDSVDSEFA